MVKAREAKELLSTKAEVVVDATLGSTGPLVAALDERGRLRLWHLDRDRHAVAVVGVDVDVCHALDPVVEQPADRDPHVVVDAEARSPVGHRVVHGGLHYRSPVVMTPEVVDDLSALITGYDMGEYNVAP